MSTEVDGQRLGPRYPRYPLLDDIELPEAEIENWKTTADLLAEIAGVPAALIMRVHPHELEVFVSSHSPGNVYHRGEKAPLGTGLYCEKVMSTRLELLVPNALKDPDWDHNPDIQLGMISYCGLPIAWPNGELFGTICILDTKENAYFKRTRDLMDRFRTLIQASLANAYSSSRFRTQRDKAESALHERETDFRLMVEGVQDYAIVMLDPAGRVVRWYAGAERIKGYRPEEIIGQHFSLFYPPEDIESGKPERELKVAAAEGRFADEGWRVRKDGSRFFASIVITALRDESGQLRGFRKITRDITERKKAEEDLRANRALLREILDSVPQAIFRKDRDSVYLGCNQQFARAAGLTDTAQVVGKTDFDLPWPREMAEAYRSDDAQVVGSGKAKRHIVERLQRADGTPIWVDTTKIPLFDGGGRVEGILGVFDDITERMQADEALRESEGQYRLLVDSTFEAVVVIHDGLIEQFNPASITMTGFSADEIVSNPFPLFVHPDDRAEIVDNYQRRMRGESLPSVLEFRLLNKDGSFRWVLANTVVNIQGNGRPASLHTLMDITEHKQAEEAVRESLLRFRRFFELPMIGSCITSPTKGWLEVNDRLCQILGYSREELWPSTWADLTHPEDLGAEVERFEGVLRGEIDAYSMEKRFVRKDGSPVSTDLSVAAVRKTDGSVDYLVALVQDITDRKKAAERIDQLNADLERRVEERTASLEAANRELDAFSHSVSHDLRAPLRAIKGFGEKVIRNHGGQLDAEGERLLGVIGSNTQRMSDLIDDLLAFSRTSRTEIRLTRLGMKEIARSAFEEVAGDPETRTKVDFRLGELPDAEGDAPLLRQVWINLLSNALKYSSHADEPVVEVTGEIEGDFAVYRVRDSGAGFDMAYADKLFGVFQRLHSVAEFEGTGIGLALVKRIVTRHGGRVWAEGEVGKGATFSFALPTRPEGPGDEGR